MGLLLELDKQRKMLNNERRANRDKLDRRTFQLFELKMKEREMFKEEWEAFQTRENERWNGLNSAQASNDQLEEDLRKSETDIETQEDVLHMAVAQHEKQERESMKQDLAGGSEKIRSELMAMKAQMQNEIDAMEKMLNARREEQKKREAAHKVFLTPRIQITPEDQPELTIKPWRNAANGKSEGQPGASEKA